MEQIKKRGEEAAEGASATQVITIDETPESSSRVEEEFVLHLQPPEEPPRVRWAADTVDNEGLGKKKSKCCCIYKKQREWNESDSDSDCETGKCRGHVEKYKKPPQPEGHGNGDGGGPSHSNN